MSYPPRRHGRNLRPCCQKGVAYNPAAAQFLRGGGVVCAMQGLRAKPIRVVRINRTAAIAPRKRHHALQAHAQRGRARARRPIPAKAENYPKPKRCSFRQASFPKRPGRQTARRPTDRQGKSKAQNHTRLPRQQRRESFQTRIHEQKAADDRNSRRRRGEYENPKRTGALLAMNGNKSCISFAAFILKIPIRIFYYALTLYKNIPYTAT